MPTYYQEVRVDVDQEWIDEHASFESEDPWHDCNEGCDHDEYAIVYSEGRMESLLMDLIYEVKYLHLHDDKSTIEILEELERRIS